MPLIIESYFQPFTKISEKMFPGKKIVFLDRPVSEPPDDAVFYYCREESAREIKYYFNKIYYIEGNRIAYLNKIKREIRYYDTGTGQLIQFSVNDNEPEDRKIDKSSFLPHLKVQEGELVLFPDNDSDEDE